MLARHGGDEFLLLACDLGSDARTAAASIAHRLLTALREPISISGLEFQISATIGVSLHPEDAESADALLRHADAAMYAGKGNEAVVVYSADGVDPRGRLCRQARDWLDSGFTPDLTFNVSLRQLYDGRFAQTVARALREHELDPRRFTAEITESATMREPECVERALEDLHGIGIKLAIDDFGAGFSSLGRLHDMPVDVLKIDRSFLRRLPSSDVAAAVVQTIVQLAGALGMTTIAEGVEEHAHRRMLAATGCEYAQGYLFGRPLPAAELAAAHAPRERARQTVGA